MKCRVTKLWFLRTLPPPLLSTFHDLSWEGEWIFLLDMMLDCTFSMTHNFTFFSNHFYFQFKRNLTRFCTGINNTIWAWQIHTEHLLQNSSIHQFYNNRANKCPKNNVINVKKQHEMTHKNIQLSEGAICTNETSCITSPTGLCGANAFIWK